MRKLLSLVASLALVGSMLAFTAPVAAAASIGGCNDATTQTFQSGEKKSGFAIRGVYGEVYLASDAGACSPNDNLGGNAAGVQIGIAADLGGAFVTMGVIQCNHVATGWPSSLCDDTYRLYAEQKGSTIWDYTMWDLGGAPVGGGTYDLQISYGCSGHSTSYCWFFNGSLVKYFDMGSGLTPTNSDVTASWQVETKDRGDGLGNNVNGHSSGIGQIQYQKQSDKLWYLKSVSGACDQIDAQHKCVANGSYGFYAYTVN